MGEHKLYLVLAAFAILAGVLVIRYPDSDLGDPEVETECGTVVGNKDPLHQTYIFKGIPYTVPPVGPLRWEAPQRLRKNDGTCWEGKLEAKNFQNQCPQIHFITKEYEGDENCLYLDVYTPELNEKAMKPVMIYIHGGYMHFGNSSTKGYAPNAAVTSHLDVVFVSIQHRLNGLGFLVLDELGKGSNYGLLDIIESLHWVQRNIQNFGGDPNHVTVFGHSAGGTFISALLVSPLAKGLFNRAWVVSGSPKMSTTWEEANQYNKFMVKKTGCKTKGCFQSLTAKQVLESLYPEWSYDPEENLPDKGLFAAALVVIDGYVLPQSPMDTWDNGHLNALDVPVLVGTTAEETDFDWYRLGGYELENWTDKEYRDYVTSKLDIFGHDVTKRCLELYPFNRNARLTLNRVITDCRVTCGNDLMTEKAVNALVSGVYRYFVTSMPSRPVYLFHWPHSCEYAFHGWELIAFFEEIPYWFDGQPLSESDNKFMTNVQENIMHFVHYGKPKDKSWGEYPTTALMSDTLSYADHHLKDECDFWLSNGFLNYSWVL